MSKIDTHPRLLIRKSTMHRVASTGSRRREFLIRSIVAAPSICIAGRMSFGADAPSSVRSRLRGLLLGSLIGDAAGGPVEFAPPAKIRDWMPATRDWDDDRQLTTAEITRLGTGFRLLPYANLRPEPAPYAHWTPSAAPGTVTDDSRHKFMLMAAFRAAHENETLPIDRRQLARQYVKYCESRTIQEHEGYSELCDEWLREYGQAARWILGERDRSTAAPPERLWGGVPTNAGQMALLPLAGPFAADPAGAYRATFHLGFMDNGTARDVNSAIVAGLAAAIGLPADQPQKLRWKQVGKAMREVDPFRFNEIPWVERPIVRWLDFAEEAANRADGSPKRLYTILEQEGEPRFHWDAHFVLASAWAILALVDFDSLAALHLSLDFGHDTDSAAQLVGALGGAVCGEEVFPSGIRSDVASRLEEDYDESVDEWTDLLLELRDRERYPKVVAEAE